MFATSSRFVPAPAVLSQETDGITVLLDPHRGGYFRLNEVGSFVWRQLNGATPFDAIVEDVAREYDAPRTVIERDVAALLEALTDAGLVELES